MITATIPAPIIAKFAETRTIAESTTETYAYPMLTQTTSYRTGDEGWQIANVWNTIYADTTEYKRPGLADHYTLTVNNQFGNTLRFSDSSGVALSEPVSDGTTFYDNYLGVQGRYSLTDFGGQQTWNNYIDTTRAYSDLSWYPMPLIIFEMWGFCAF